MSQEVLEFINNFDKDYLEGKSYIFEKFEKLKESESSE